MTPPKHRPVLKSERGVPIHHDLRSVIESAVTKTERGCWEWGRPIAGDGYGEISVAGVRLRAHRVSYMIFHGDIPVGLVIDHLCMNPRCVNPDHLEAVSVAENTRRWFAVKPLTGRRRDFCLKGHVMTPENSLMASNGRRRCRTCYRDWHAARRARKVAEAS